MIDHQKRELREKISFLKNQISFDEKKSRSLFIFKRVVQLKEFKKSKTILLYWSMKDEVYTHDFIQNWAGKKKIILPSVKGDTLVLKKFKGYDDLVEGESFGIEEPSGELFVSPNEIDMIVVPGIAFDKQNNRLGRGKAYYDKLLKTSIAYKVGVCFGFQMLDSVPTKEHDVKMDIVITDI